MYMLVNIDDQYNILGQVCPGSRSRFSILLIVTVHGRCVPRVFNVYAGSLKPDPLSFWNTALGSYFLDAALRNLTDAAP